MKRRSWNILVSLLAILFLTSVLSGSLFDKAEYAARRLKLMEKIPDGVAIILGAQSQSGYYEFYQNNDFVYFTGVEIPNSVLIIDG